jgi:hypothetical protein
MHIGFYAGRRVALLNRAAPSLIDRCVFCGKPTLLIVSFPVASSLTCCMHQQMHMLANFGRSICARSSSSQGLCIIRLAACLSCLVCMRACEIRLVRFPCRPSTIISLRSAFINASHWNCVCRCPQEADLQPRPCPQQASLLWALVRGGKQCCFLVVHSSRLPSSWA